MSKKSFSAMEGERFSSAQALFKHLGQLQRQQFDSISAASARSHQAILGPMREGQAQELSAADFFEYWIDFGQRSLLYLDALRQRGDNTLAHERAGYPLLLNFPYETLIDGRDLSQPVNYALLKVIPESDQPSSEKRVPVIIIDPRAGPGAGIGGFQQESTVGESLRAGHPTYYIAFSHSPVPGQTLNDINLAQAHFIEEVIKRHPKAGKPIVIGNCQAGWALMGLAAARPELPGLVIINGAPLSSRESGDEHSPMRYVGGLLGGAWMTRLASDLGSGRFDGAWLVNYFESLNPANTYWSKYYNLFSNVDSETPNFLDFERWWGNPVLMNSEEIEAIVDDLFIGNRLAGGLGRESSEIDLSKIEAPVVVFCSYGDVITPPQQALNWIADIYPSDLALRSSGRTIVYLKHATIDHLEMFVSGAVARREHRGLLAASEAIALLTPGLYEMTIDDVSSTDGAEHSYEVHFESRRIADILPEDNERDDEPEFTLVDQTSQINNALYESYIRPWIRGTINEPFAELMRKTHPLRMQQYAYSSLNPVLSWLTSSASVVRANRQPVSSDNPLLTWQETFADLVERQLNTYREVRDTSQKMNFHALYGGLSSLTGAQQALETQKNDSQQQDKDLTERLRGSLSQGGAAEALARVLFLFGQKSGRFSQDRVEQLAEQSRNLIKEHNIDLSSIRDLIELQGLLVFAHPAESLETLPRLLTDNAQRKTLLETVLQLVPELSTADGAVGELWRQLHQLLEQPMSVLAESKLPASTDSTETIAPAKAALLAEEKTTPVKTAESKLEKPAAPTPPVGRIPATKPTTKPTTKPATSTERAAQTETVTSDKKRIIPAKTAVKKPTKKAQPKARTARIKQEALPTAETKTDTTVLDKKNVTAAPAPVEKPLEATKSAADTAATKPEAPATQIDSAPADKKQSVAVPAPVEKPLEATKPAADTAATKPEAPATQIDSAPADKKQSVAVPAPVEKPLEATKSAAGTAATKPEAPATQIDSAPADKKQRAEEGKAAVKKPAEATPPKAQANVAPKTDKSDKKQK